MIKAYPLSVDMDRKAISQVRPPQSEWLSFPHSADKKPSDTNPECGLGHNHALQLRTVTHVGGWPDESDLLRRENW